MAVVKKCWISKVAGKLNSKQSLTYKSKNLKNTSFKQKSSVVGVNLQHGTAGTRVEYNQ